MGSNRKEVERTQRASRTHRCACRIGRGLLSFEFSIKTFRTFNQSKILPHGRLA
jgi:hypothetical protein